MPGTKAGFMCVSRGGGFNSTKTDCGDTLWFPSWDLLSENAIMGHFEGT